MNKGYFRTFTVVFLLLCVNLVGGYLLASTYKNNALTLTDNALVAKALPLSAMTVNVYKDQNLITTTKVQANKTLIVPFTSYADGTYYAKLETLFFNLTLPFQIDSAPPQLALNYENLSNDTKTQLDIIVNESAKTVIDPVNQTTGVPVVATDNADVELAIGPGENIFEVCSTDIRGNKTVKNITITGDFAAPDVTAITKSGTVYGKNIDLELNINDNYKPKSISINGITSSIGKNGKYTFPVAISQGDNKFKVIATDFAGNSKEQDLDLNFNIQEANPVPILMFHHISAQQVETNSLSEDLFEQLLIWLKDNNYSTISFKQLDAHLLDGTEIPKKSVILSFDDGYWNNYTNAFRLLKKYNMVGSFGVIPNLVGTWAHNIRWYMSWDEIKEMSDAGMEIVSHTYSHPTLSNLNDIQLKHELLDSKEVIEQHTGKTVETLIYPSGMYNNHVIALAREYGYKSARINGPGGIVNKNNMYTMPIIRVSWGNSASLIGKKIMQISK